MGLWRGEEGFPHLPPGLGFPCIMQSHPGEKYYLGLSATFFFADANLAIAVVRQEWPGLAKGVQGPHRKSIPSYPWGLQEEAGFSGDLAKPVKASPPGEGSSWPGTTYSQSDSEEETCKIEKQIKGLGRTIYSRDKRRKSTSYHHWWLPRPHCLASAIIGAACSGVTCFLRSLQGESIKSFQNQAPTGSPPPCLFIKGF